MRHWFLSIALILSLSACRLSLGSQSDPTPTTQPVATTVVQTAVPSQPTATKTLTPTATPTKPVTSGGSTGGTPCQRRTDWPTYTVVSGDTLGKIAERTSSDVATLTAGNCLQNANQISAGQALYVPRAPVVIPPTATTVPASGDGFVLSSLPANAACYLQLYGMADQAAVRPSPDSNQTLVTISYNYFYRIYSQTPTHYEIAYNTQGQTGWVDKIGGSPVGDCRVLTQVAARPVTVTYDGIAFDYPSNWYSGFNIDGMPGGHVGSIRVSDIPPMAQAWTNDMVLIGFTIMPDGIVPTDLEAAARQEADNWRNSDRNAIVQEVTPYTNATGLNGFVFEYTGPMTGARVYYFHINNKTVVISVNGNRAMGEAVVSTLRPA